MSEKENNETQVLKLKAEIFDLLVAQSDLQKQIQQIEKKKLIKVEALNKLKTVRGKT